MAYLLLQLLQAFAGDLQLLQVALKCLILGLHLLQLCLQLLDLLAAVL